MHTSSRSCSHAYTHVLMQTSSVLACVAANQHAEDTVSQVAANLRTTWSPKVHVLQHAFVYTSAKKNIFLCTADRDRMQSLMNKMHVGCPSSYACLYMHAFKYTDTHAYIHTRNKFRMQCAELGLPVLAHALRNVHVRSFRHVCLHGRILQLRSHAGWPHGGTTCYNTFFKCLEMAVFVTLHQCNARWYRRRCECFACPQCRQDKGAPCMACPKGTFKDHDGLGVCKPCGEDRSTLYEVEMSAVLQYCIIVTWRHTRELSSCTNGS